MSAETTITVRAIERDDRAAWTPLWDAYNAFYGRSGETALAPEITEMLWSRFFDAYEPVHGMVAEEAGSLVGLVHAVYDYARAAGSTRVYWQTHETNTTAMQLYDKIAENTGFIIYRKLL
jgi:hypothetical protein